MVKMTSRCGSRGVALVISLLLVLILAAAGLYLLKMGQRKNSAAQNNRVEDISAQISDAGLKRGYLDLKQFLLQEGVLANPSFLNTDYLNAGFPVDYLVGDIDNAAPGAVKRQDMRDWQLARPGGPATPIHHLYKDQVFPDGSAYSAVIIPAGKPMGHRDVVTGQQKVDIFYQFAVRSRPAAVPGQKALSPKFNEETMARDFFLAPISESNFQRLFYQASGTPTFEFLPQFTGGKVERNIYGTFKLTFVTSGISAYLYVANEEDHNIVVIDLNDGSTVSNPIDVPERPCKLWVDQQNFRYLFVSHCNTDRKSKILKDTQGHDKIPRFSVIDLMHQPVPPGAPLNPQLVATYDNILMHDISFRQEEGMPIGYGIDINGNTYAIDQRSGALQSIPGMNLCQRAGVAADACRGVYREYDYATGVGGVFNSLVLRPDGRAYATLITPGLLIDFSTSGTVTYNSSTDIPAPPRRTGYGTVFEGVSVPHDLDLANYHLVAFQNQIPLPSNSEAQNSYLRQDFLGHIGGNRTGEIQARTGSRLLRRDSIDAAYDIYEEPYLYYPTFALDRTDEAASRSLMKFNEINLDTTAEQQVGPLVDNLPIRWVEAYPPVPRGPRSPGCQKFDYNCEPETPEESDPIYVPVSSAATKIGAIFNEWAGLAMTKIGAVMGIHLPTPQDPETRFKIISLKPDYDIYSQEAPEEPYQPSAIQVTPDGRYVVLTAPRACKEGHPEFVCKPKIFLGNLWTSRLCEIYPDPNGGCGQEVNTRPPDNTNPVDAHVIIDNDDHKEVQQGVTNPSAFTIVPPPR